MHSKGYIYIKVRFIKSIECEYDYTAYKLHKWKIIFYWEAHGVKNKLPGILEKRREGWGTFLVMDSSLSLRHRPDHSQLLTDGHRV